MSRGGTAHLSDSPLPGLQWSCHPLFVCICMLHNRHVTNRQTICKHAKYHRSKAQKKEHTGTEQHHYRYMRSYSKHTAHTNAISFLFFRSSSSEPTSNTECRRTADSNSFSCSLWLLQKLEPSILTLIRANEQHGHVLSKDPQTGANSHSSLSFAVFFFPQENRCYALYSDD